jgi:hypothetical protein
VAGSLQEKDGFKWVILKGIPQGLNMLLKKGNVVSNSEAVEQGLKPYPLF